MSILALIPLILIAAVIIWLLTLPAEFEVKRSRFIAAPATDLFPQISDFHAWRDWNPWLPHEPDATLTFSETSATSGSWYTWDGKIIGAGKMTHELLNPPCCIDQQLEFTRPMRSKSAVYWRLNQLENGTEVTWGMRGKMPFLFRWMSTKMDEWVGKDYEIGLARLATQCGDHSQPILLEYPGEVTGTTETYLYKRYNGSLENLPQVMQAEFPALMKVVAEQAYEITGPAFAAYHEFDMKSNQVSCDIAVPVAQAKPIDDYSVGQLQQQRYSRTVLYGAYEHLPLAWYSAINHARMAKIKVKKGAPMIERYPTDPAESTGLDQMTWIDLPLR